MKKVLVSVVSVLAIAGVFYQIYPHRSAGRSIFDVTTHPMAPNFLLKTVDGQTLDLASYRGNVVLLDFWATWCEPCRVEIPRLIEWQNKYGAQGLQILGISLDDDAGPVREFYRQFKMNYPVAVGNARLAESYGGILGLPVSFLIGRDGRIYTRHGGETNPPALETEIKSMLRGRAPHPL